MGKGRLLMERLSEDAYSPVDTFPGHQIVEIVGDRRVLVENHCGILSYCTERILVKARCGNICILGQELRLLRMTKEQLVICGVIHSVSIQRRSEK